MDITDGILEKNILEELEKKNFKIQRQLGSGGTSQVFLATDKSFNTACAVKKVKPEFNKFADLEIYFLSKLKHPNIIKIIDFGVLSDESKFIVMEYAIHGDLYHSWLSQRRFFPEDSVRSIIFDISLAVSHCHEKSIAHLDIKPENVIITTDSTGIVAKLCDFGYALEYEGVPFYGPRGTVPYISHEVAKGDFYGISADVWQIAVLAYECLTGKTPFERPDDDPDNDTAIMERIVKLEYSIDGISAEATEFITTLLVPQVFRPSAVQIFNHGWLKGVMASKTNKATDLVIKKTIKKARRHSEEVR
jgi:serine/threonine protein kinase